MNETPSKPESPETSTDPKAAEAPGESATTGGGRDPKVIFLAAAAGILAIVIGAVLVFGGGTPDVDNTDISTKPVIVAGEGDPPSEVVTEDIVEGEGPGAQEGDTLTVQYVGALFETAEEFDASWDRGQPFDVTLGQGQVIQGWEQGLIGMKAGGRREIIIPSELGYGPSGSPDGGIPPDAALIFIVDLEKIAKGN